LEHRKIINVMQIGMWSNISVVSLQLINPKAKTKAVPLHALEALGVRGGIAPTHS
jgi:hypothetical protein